MSKTIVVFTEAGARVVKDKILLPLYDKSKVVIDPDISHHEPLHKTIYPFKVKLLYFIITVGFLALFLLDLKRLN